MTGVEEYRKLAQPPSWALRPIPAGRLKGKSDINPQWRIQAMTEAYGLCGVGWKFEVKANWTEPGPDGQVFAFAEINLYIKIGQAWSDPIPGHGGNMLVEQEKAGLHANDEGFKMAITDALGTAMKMLGVAADVYAGMWDGSRFRQEAGPDAVELQEISSLKKTWAGVHADVIAGKDKPARLVAFTQWVQQVTGRAFDVDDFRYWTREEMDQCREAMAQ